VRKTCNTPQVITETILCAKTCTVKWNDAPVAKFSFDNYVISDDSQYFDSENLSQRQMRWALYCGDALIYEFGFGNHSDSITELSNGSTYSQMNLGLNNIDILNFVESIPSTIVPLKTKFRLYLDVKDDSGIESENISNVYYFTI
jgi:hypothetical protein